MTDVSYKQIKLRDANLVQHEGENITNALFTFAAEITDTYDEATGRIDFFEKQKVDRDALKDRLNCLDQAGLIHSRFFVDGEGLIWQAYYNMTREKTPEGEKVRENLVAYEVYDGDETPDDNGDGLLNDDPVNASKYPFIAPEDIGNTFVNAPDAAGTMQNEFKDFIAEIWGLYQDGMQKLETDLKGHEIEPDARGLEIIKAELAKGGSADLVKILQQLYAPSFLSDNEEDIEIMDLYHRYLNQALALAKSDPVGHAIPEGVVPWNLAVFVHGIKKAEVVAPEPIAAPPPPPVAAPSVTVVTIREPSFYGMNFQNSELIKDSKLAFFPEGKTKWVEAENNDMDEVIDELVKITDPSQIEAISLECFSSATYETARNKNTGQVITILPSDKYPTSPHNIKKIHSGKKDILNDPWEWVTDKLPPQDTTYNKRVYPNKSNYSPNRGESVLAKMAERGVHPEIIAKARAGMQIKGGTFRPAAQLSYTLKAVHGFKISSGDSDFAAIAPDAQASVTKFIEQVNTFFSVADDAFQNKKLSADDKKIQIYQYGVTIEQYLANETNFVGGLATAKEVGKILHEKLAKPEAKNVPGADVLKQILAGSELLKGELSETKAPATTAPSDIAEIAAPSSVAVPVTTTVSSAGLTTTTTSDPTQIVAEKLQAMGLAPPPPAVNPPQFGTPKKFEIAEAPSVTITGGDASQIDLDTIEFDASAGWTRQVCQRLGIATRIEARLVGNNLILDGLADASLELATSEQINHGLGDYPIIIRSKDGSWHKKLVFECVEEPIGQ